MNNYTNNYSIEINSFFSKDIETYSQPTAKQLAHRQNA